MAIPKLLIKSPLHFVELRNINLNALKIIQYKVAAITKIVAQIMAPTAQNIMEPKSASTIQIKNEPTQPVSPSLSMAPMSKSEMSKVLEEGFFHNLNLTRKLPKSSLSFPPL